MLTALIILVVYIVGSAIIRWAHTPSKNYTPPYPPGSGKRFKVETLRDLIIPRLEDDEAESDK